MDYNFPTHLVSLKSWKKLKHRNTFHMLKWTVQIFQYFHFYTSFLPITCKSSNYCMVFIQKTQKTLQKSNTVGIVVLKLSSINYGSFLIILQHVKVKTDASTKTSKHTQTFHRCFPHLFIIRLATYFAMISKS